MTSALHIVCPHWDSINRVPRERLREGGKCGSCHRPLFEGRPAALNSVARFDTMTATAADTQMQPGGAQFQAFLTAMPFVRCNRTWAFSTDLRTRERLYDAMPCDTLTDVNYNRCALGGYAALAAQPTTNSNINERDP
ncbi:MAG: hypothetical protein ACXU89_05440 [Xanthobacteraceae bacterium]